MMCVDIVSGYLESPYTHQTHYAGIVKLRTHMA